MPPVFFPYCTIRGINNNLRKRQGQSTRWSKTIGWFYSTMKAQKQLDAAKNHCTTS